MMSIYHYIPRSALFFLLSFLYTTGAWPIDAEPVWLSENDTGDTEVHLYFFWSKKCPHCLEAQPFIEQLDRKHAWIKLHSLELTGFPAHAQKYSDMAASLGEEARSVPAFFWCGVMVTGYDNEQGMGRFLLNELSKCHENKGKTASRALAPVTLPFFGEVSPQRYSLPVYTIVLAGLDAFNPCAFFVLLFLLSLLVNAKSRARIMLVGGIFVFFSGLLYFLFMSAWLNVFLLIGQVDTITRVAGGVAVLIALINIKDYFWFKQGVSLSIPDAAKPGLFQRMRNTVQAGNLAAVLIATIALAGFANMYEFLCTAGFPMVFTRILTLHELETASYYLYLLLYNVVYVIPLLLIVVLFSVTMGKRKLSETQGRALKLLSGLMMLCLGLVLIIDSQWLNHAGIAALILLAASVLTGLIIVVERRSRKQPTKP